MNTINKFFFLLLLVGGVCFSGCVDNDFDEPENTFKIDDSNVLDISEILGYLNGNAPVVLDADKIGEEDRYIKATITASDASGNFYKTLVFQDATGALSIIPDRNELNAEFPQGSLVYIKLNGLTLTLDAELPRLGYSYIDDRLQRIPDILVNDYCIPGGAGEEIAPLVTTISDINQNPDNFMNKLVVLENVEFSLSNVGQTYADANNTDGPQTINAIIEDCNDESIILRNSGFADFATELVPQGNGNLTVIASRFRDDLQLFIRDLNDVQFEGDRCDGSGGTATNEIEISDIKSRYYDLGADAAEVGFISGVVISDRNNPSHNNQNIVLQNGSHGIVVRFSSEHSFNVGDQLEVTVSGQEVSEFNDLLQINNVPTFNVVIKGNGSLPAAKEVTIDEILEDQNNYESTRVLIKNAELSGSTYGSNVTVDDGTESIQLYTRSTASFAGDNVPSGKVELTAIVGHFNNPQVIINDLDDVVGGTTGGGGGGGGGNTDGDVNVDFEGEEDFEPVDYDGWLNIATKGDRVWYFRSFDGNGFGEMEAYQDESPETEAWLITPTIDTDDKSILSFETAQAFWQHQGLSVWISADFDNVDDANWISLDAAKIANSNDEQYTMISSGDVDLTDYLGGKVRVGWKYEGTASSNTTKMRIDNVMLK